MNDLSKLAEAGMKAREAGSPCEPPAHLGDIEKMAWVSGWRNEASFEEAQDQMAEAQWESRRKSRR